MSAFAFRFRRLAGLALIACVLAAAGIAAERIPPAPKRFVTDETRTLARATVERLNSRLEQYERESSNQILVALFARMETDSSVEDYTVRVAESWRVGQKGKNNGAVLFVFKQDRQIYIQVGYGLEPTLTDAVSHQIVEDILKPRFRAGDFDGGVSAAVEAMISATRGEFKGTGRTRAEGYQPNTARGGFIFLALAIGLPLFLILIVRQAMRGPVVIGGPRRRGPNVWWDHSGSGGAWGGGSSGGGWLGGGGGGGGFSGGGGSFGGGGAGGKW